MKLNKNEVLGRVVRVVGAVGIAVVSSRSTILAGEVVNTAPFEIRGVCTDSCVDVPDNCTITKYVPCWTVGDLGRPLGVGGAGRCCCWSCSPLVREKRPEKN
ncbi:hypothetical protein KKA02_03075 [Patescibacteria group bacterium]|nr:hypothetical protein [Patescibacteria group bacterium]